jgi:hypothetical protein
VIPTLSENENENARRQYPKKSVYTLIYLECKLQCATLRPRGRATSTVPPMCESESESDKRGSRMPG